MYKYKLIKINDKILINKFVFFKYIYKILIMINFLYIIIFILILIFLNKKELYNIIYYNFYKIKNISFLKFIYFLFKLVKYIFLKIYFIFILYIIKTFFFEMFYIPSDSMSPYFIPGDIVLVNKIYYNFKFPFIKFNYIFENPKKNDIIVFKCPFNNKINLIKRIAGIPGDKIFYNNYLNKYILFIINKNLKLYSKNNIKYKNLLNKFLIPKNYYFVLGDNLEYSYDSRYWGLLHKKYILGKVIYKICNINFYSNKKIKILFKKINYLYENK